LLLSSSDPGSLKIVILGRLELEDKSTYNTMWMYSRVKTKKGLESLKEICKDREGNWLEGKKGICKQDR